MKVSMSGISETLLITLFAKAKDYEEEKSILNDKKSNEILKKIDYDFKKFNLAWKSYYGIVARTKIMDEEVNKFLERNPNAVIINVGCGLDNRFQRINNREAVCYNLDLPEVISLREKLFEESEREKNIAKSMLDPEWPQYIKEKNREILIVSEGVAMYLSEEEIKKFLEILKNNFKKFELHLDLISKYMVKKSSMHDTLKHMDAELKFGVGNGDEILKLLPGLKKKKIINFTKKFKEILPANKIIYHLMLPLIYILNNRLGIYEYDLE